MLCTLDVSEALEDLEGEWSNKDPRESWVALKKGPRGEHFVVEVDVGGRKCGAFIDIGSTQNYISRDCLERLHLQDRVRHLSRPVASTLANKERMIVTDYIKDVVCTFSYGGGELNHKISFLVSDDLPFDMLLGMYYLEVAKPLFDWDKKVLKHKLPDGRTVRLTKFKASSIINTYGCLCASAFYNYYKQNEEEGMYLVYVSEKGEAVKTPPEIERVVAKFPDLFEEPTGVVEREVVHAIEIIPGSKTPKGRIYRMVPTELDELRRQLKELTEKGWIRPSTSPYGSPVLFVPKKGGTLRMCIDYRGLNAITVKNAEPLPRIDDLLDRVQGCKYYGKLDLKSGYHQIAKRSEDQHKTAFQTRYGLYEFVVMPFGLCNASGTFQHAMNRIFHAHLDKFVVVYLDDILIFGKSAEEHAQHVETVLSLLQQHKYKVNLKKCEFGRTKILYLGHEVSAEGIRPEDAKVASIRDWPRPQTVTEVRSFLGMCGYYRNFVKNYSTVASPLTDLTRLDTPWDWSDECEGAFKRLKHALMNHEVLMVPDPQKPFIVTTDASQYGIGASLALKDGKKLRPIEYMSKKMPSKKLVKSTYESELYALYKALVHWRHFLLGRFFYLRTDHQTLKWIKTQPTLSNALKRWIEVIDQYDFKLEYLKGEYNKVADALSRQSVSMDFMDTLVTSKSGKRHIFVIIDRFTKYARLVAMPETARTDYVIKLFKDNWVRDFGLPKSIVSDRDVRFTSEL
uniref:Reverse transcriptase n=1 Tax=Chara braunii TaxID=69332 RepID=A0A388KKV7_CHABU